MFKIAVFLIVLICGGRAFSQDCADSYSQWSMDSKTVDYIVSTVTNHSRLEIRNYNTWAACSNAEFSYGRRRQAMPEQEYRAAMVVRNKARQIRSFLSNCKFANNYNSGGKVSDACPSRSKKYSEILSERGQKQEMSCTLSDYWKSLIVKIGPVEYRFPYNKNEVLGPGVHNRNLEQNIDLRQPSISLNGSSLFNSCSARVNQSQNFCYRDGIKLQASSQSLVCSTDHSSGRYCVYGRRSGSQDRLRVDRASSCPLMMRKSSGTSHAIQSQGADGLD